MQIEKKVRNKSKFNKCNKKKIEEVLRVPIRDSLTNVFYRWNIPHITRWFCGLVLDQITISNMILESPSRSVRPHAIRFLLSNHPPFMSTSQMPSLGRDGVC